MTEKLELYKCHICGNLIQILNSGIGELVCCNQPMENLKPNNIDDNAVAEKHVPQIEIFENKRYITLRNHPMIEEHYIQFIEAYPTDKSTLYIKFLKPNEIAEMEIANLDESITAQEHCNIHGLWRNNND